MDFHKLNYILAIAKYKNLSKAAEALYVGQPTLSKCLNSLEAELGLKLFRKLGNRYELTYAGERYVDVAAEILKLKAGLDAELMDIRQNDIGELNIAFANMRIGYTLPQTLPVFQKAHPNVKVNVYEGNSAENDRRLLDGDIELAFYSKPDDPNPLIEYTFISKEELLICTCAGHPLSRFATPNPNSRYPALDLSLLCGEKVLMMRPQQRTRQAVDKLLQKWRLCFSNTAELSSMSAIIGLVAEGYGVSLLFDSHIEHRLDRRPIDCYSLDENGVYRDFVAAHRKGSYLSEYAREYIEIVRNAAEAELMLSPSKG